MSDKKRNQSTERKFVVGDSQTGGNIRGIREAQASSSGGNTRPPKISQPPKNNNSGSNNNK